MMEFTAMELSHLLTLLSDAEDDGTYSNSSEHYRKTHYSIIEKLMAELKPSEEEKRNEEWLNKVYCRNCRWVKSEPCHADLDLVFECGHTVCFVMEDTPITRIPKRIHDCNDLNKNNDCVHFVKCGKGGG